MKSKKIILTIFVCLVGFNMAGQRQKVYSYIKQKNNTTWYKNQADLWKDYLNENKKDGPAWQNYYTAKRMIRVSGGSIEQKELDEIVSDMAKAIPNSFEYHYIVFWNASFNQLEDNFHHLKKAYELAPDRRETLVDFLTYYEMKRDKPKLEEVSKKWFVSNDIAPGLFYWNYNVLQSVTENALLITSGDNDTYPALVMQYANGIRQDVNVLNHSLLGVPEYRARYFKELDIPLFQKTEKDFDTYPAYQQALLRHLKSNTSRPIYFSVSADPKLYKPFKKEVYNVGMAYKWSDTKFDNIAVIKKNYEKNYLIDYLKFDPSIHISNGIVDHMNTNYLISLLPLYNHYEESADVRKYDIELIIDKIARKNNLEERVAKILGKSKRSSVISYVIQDPRKLERGLVKIKDNFYGGYTEVTNEMYDLFLTDLLKQKRYDELNIAKADKVDWHLLLPKEYKKLPDTEIFPGGHPSGPTFPVVNISHEAALLYCEWLTAVYNGLEHRKKKFSHVQFRLPTKEEWEFMALGGKEQAPYTWGGPYIRNARGCFLANVRALASDRYAEGGKLQEIKHAACAIDGGTFPVVVKSYFPNEYGMYNMTGNVSEMIDEVGIVKGGSWNTPAGIATIKSQENINGPSPEVGFRVVMIVN